MAALCYEVGADAYVCVNTATTRTVLWIVARATERRNLIRENRRLAQAERHRQQHEQHEAERLLGEQRGLVRDLEALRGVRSDDAQTEASGENGVALGERVAPAAEPPRLDDGVRTHYRELMRAHVIMGSGNLSAEMSALAELLAASGVTAPQAMKLHVDVLEELVRGLGSRSARHVMTRADLLVLEILVHLSESYRLRCPAAGVESRPRSP
jgi:hypothetical protein